MSFMMPSLVGLLKRVGERAYLETWAKDVASVTVVSNDILQMHCSMRVNMARELVKLLLTF